ncbi:MAG TPA: hypothetical protein VM010_05870 [Chitinophagaceae bacterium]|nr:hypothetical protein [Chitinophagaceae bacterium]
MLTSAFIIAFIVYFIKATTWKGMIFHGVIEKLNWLPKKLRKPLFECPICMTPWWGVAIYLVGYYSGLEEFNELSFRRLIFTVFAAAGINTLFLILNKIYDTLATHEKKEEKPVEPSEARMERTPKQVEPSKKFAQEPV